MKIQFYNNRIHKYFYIALALILTFWLISLFEVLYSYFDGIQINVVATIFYKFINDFWAGVIIAILLFPIFYILSFIKYGVVVMKVLFTIVIIAQISLVKYSLTTLLNLGADLLGYSLDDIYLTVSASHSFSFFDIIQFLLFPVIYWFLIDFLYKRISSGRVSFIISVLLIILFGSLKIVFYQTANPLNENKIAYLTEDIIKYKSDQQQINSYVYSGKNDYPFLKPFSETKDVLSPFFYLNQERPNIVIIMVEGLGDEFIGNNAYKGFTPYLDSLIPKSLYWENFVSNAGRTFGVYPSVLGSLPFGQNGFMELTPFPSHLTILSILKANGYVTSSYMGGNSTFDRVINFLDYNQTDYVVDESKYGKGYVKQKANSGGFSWGYPDKEIYRKALSTFDSKNNPRLDVIMTTTNHEPFNWPDKDKYVKKVKNFLNTNYLFGVSKKFIKDNIDIFASILYTDNSLKNFMEAYAKRPDYNNTIFIITGDHRLIPLPQKDKLCRFHVPLFIYSPMLKRTARFKSISSHWDITPSILAFLMNNYQFKPLKQAAFMGSGLDTVRKFRNIHKIPLMRYKGNINDYIYEHYFYSGGNLFRIKKNFGIYKVHEKVMRQIIIDSLNQFKKLNIYVTKKNRIFPENLNIYGKPQIIFTPEQQRSIKKITKGLTYDEVFKQAREFAYNNKRAKARLLCDYILNQFPNYTDVRVLKGRTLAWDGSYKKAEKSLLNALNRDPFYEDTYNALLDLYWWSGNDDKSILLMDKARKNKINSNELNFKLAKAYQRLNKIDLANKLIDSLLKISPNNKKYLTFKNSLK